MRFILPCLLLITAGTGLSQPAPPPEPVDDSAPAPPRRLHLMISPMGEPVRGPEGGSALVDQWFNGVDANHDGKLSHSEFVADARRFFKVVDTNHDGIIDTDEVQNYETVIAPEISGGSFGGGGRPGGGGGMGGGGHRGGGHGGGMGGGMGGGGMHGGRGGMGGDGMGEMEGSSAGGVAPSYDSMRFGAARFSLLNIPEPVSSADADLDRSVLASEFDAAAMRRFDMLDTNGDGAIDRSELPELESRGGGHRRH